MVVRYACCSRCGLTQERFVEDEVTQVSCGICGETAKLVKPLFYERQAPGEHQRERLSDPDKVGGY